jgi:hypothetical protein
MNGDQREFVRQSLDSAIRRFIAGDFQLLVLDVNERSVTHKLAEYLQDKFPAWHVDCEYNRDHDDPKRLNIPRGSISTDDDQGTTVFPDIIVHKRDTDENLIVIEVKKSTNSQGDSYDMQKLNAFKSELGYKYAAFLKLRTGPGSTGIDSPSWV